MNSRSPSKVFILFLSIVAVAGAVLILYSSSRYGPAISNDSVQYISIARNLALEGKFESYLPGPVTKWPPIYPLIVALISRVAGRVQRFRRGLVRNAHMFGHCSLINR